MCPSKVTLGGGSFCTLSHIHIDPLREAAARLAQVCHYPIPKQQRPTREAAAMLADLAGFNHSLQKPCDPQILLRMLQPLALVRQAMRRRATDRSAVLVLSI